MNLANLTPQQFLDRHWQKQPLLIRRAFEDFTPPLDPDELAGLACEEKIEARIVIEQPGGTPPWIVRHGPFTAKDFTHLPETHWTLLVQDVDKYVPECAHLLEHFSFIPSWRIDDLMISYAAPSGSVGPHTDMYDVFLLQAAGERRWAIDKAPESTTVISGIQLKILENFTADDTWTLTPGDMLYLPPGVAHHGIALGEAMTYSIGFRAPSDTELLADFAGWLAQRANPGGSYADPDLRLNEAEAGLIASTARERIRTKLRHYLAMEDAELDRWFGCFITEQKPWLIAAPPDEAIETEELISRLRAGARLQRAPAARINFIPGTLFCDGEAYDLPPAAAEIAPLLAGRRDLSWADLAASLKIDAVAELLAGLYNAGKFYFDD